MAVEVAFSEDPARVLNDARKFLASEPVLHNLIRTLLHRRVALPEPGRYWVAHDGCATVGVAFQSPLDFPASVTPMGPEVVEAVVAAVVDDGVRLPGVIGEAATAARFAGQWAERCKSAAVPIEGQRIYEVREVRPGCPGPRSASAGRARRPRRRSRMAAGLRGRGGRSGNERIGRRPALGRRGLLAVGRR